MRAECDEADRHEDDDIASVDPGDGPEEDREGLRRVSRIERQEEDAEAEAEGHDHADDGVALADANAERTDEEAALTVDPPAARQPARRQAGPPRPRL